MNIRSRSSCPTPSCDFDALARVACFLGFAAGHLGVMPLVAPRADFDAEVLGDFDAWVVAAGLTRFVRPRLPGDEADLAPILDDLPDDFEWGHVLVQARGPGSLALLPCEYGPAHAASLN